MKCIVIGLGNFGIALAQRLTALDHEVLGVDKEIEKVNNYKDSVKNTICLDLSNGQAARNLPLKDSDIVFVTLGKDIGASIMAVAILKQNEARRIIARSISPLHKTVLEAMGISEIISLEEEYADIFTMKTELTTSLYSYRINESYIIYEMKLPEAFIGRKLADIKLEKDFSLKLIAIRHNLPAKGKNPAKMELITNPEEDFTVEADDIFILAGNQDKFRALSQE